MPSPRLLFLTAVLLSVSSGAAHGDDPRSRAILDKAGDLSRTTRHWSDRQQTLELEIIDRRGGVRQRALQMWTKRYDEDESRTVLFFRDPPQARGVGFLQWVDPTGPDHQWLYLPSNKRVRQISGSRKKESFVGTDFSYEDLGLMMDVVTWSAAAAESEYEREQSIEGVRCAVIRLVPAAAQDVSYGALRLWIGLEDSILYRYAFEDSGGKLKKVLVLSDVRDVHGIPAPHRLEMMDSKAGSRTVAIVKSLEFDVGLSDDLFTKRHLERGGPQ